LKVGTSSRLIMRSRAMFIMAAALTAAINGIAAGQQYRIETSVQPESLTVGDKFLYVNRIEEPGDARIEPLPPGETLGEASVLSSVFKLEGMAGDTMAFACTLAVYQPGRFEIPTLTFVISDTSGNATELSGDPMTLEIRSVLPPDTSGLEIADIREPYRLRGPIWPYLIIPLAAALILLGLILIRKRLGGRAAVPATPPRPPWEVAFEELDDLKRKRHPEFGRIRQYYFELSLIIRAYLERRYGFPAVESTTYEIENQVPLKAVDEKLYERLFDFFFRADMSKFAKLDPSRKEAEADLSFAIDFVRRTIPVAEQPSRVESKNKGAVEEDVPV
jgi:hypothetical protein